MLKFDNMELLIISIICSVSVGILFKMYKLSSNEYYFSFFCGYIVCFLLSNIFFEINFNLLEFSPKYIFIILALSLLMPSLFLFLNKSIQTNGIAKTDLAQRISLIIPILASFTLFNESFSYSKFYSITLGLLSVFLIFDKSEKKIHTFNKYSLVIIFLGYGFVDILFKSLTKIPFQSALSFVFIGCIITTLFYIIIKKVKFSLKPIIFGILLGCLNFTNIYSYMLAHQEFFDSPTIVFATMNLGVISLGALIGKVFFKEQLSNKNILGIVLSFFVILILTFKLFD